MIRKLLIANRGEVAVRIIRACRELDIRTVAIYSEADANAEHVRLADEDVCVGPASSALSYLNIDAVLRAAATSGADAVHPGYGFLSQNAGFARACEKAGLIFVGPDSTAIARMGSKIEARRLMEGGGVPVVPGETPKDQSDEAIEQAVQRIGLPAVIKASAGGGGKGMRRVGAGEAVGDAIRAARREAVAAFGDGTLYVERLIEHAHHVEVQVFGDHQGHIIHLFERECSIQRRHQKIIEETPSPIIDQALRDRITRAGVAAGVAVAYRNAGTVEFLVDAAVKSFYFLEMNTRLQVEHPITEQLLGIDIVRAQLLVAAGEPLPWPQQSLSPRGHAIEARVYAEDPERGFLPQAGRLLLYREPRHPGIRIDSGVVEGNEISVHYDPLLAKVIATAETRDAATRRLVQALKDFPILGIRTNIPFLIRILEHPRFGDGTMDTEFLDTEGSKDAALGLSPKSPASNQPAQMPAIVRRAIDGHVQTTRPSSGVPASAQIWDPWGGASTGASSAASRREPESSETPSRPIASAEPKGSPVFVAGTAADAWAFWNGQVYRSSIDEERKTAARSVKPGRSAGPHALTAPMPGTVLKVLVGPGGTVAKGDAVLILEAMKMEIPLRALDAGTVSAVHCKEGDLVQADKVLVELA